MTFVAPEEARPDPTPTVTGRAYTRVMVPLDGTQFAEAALHPAALLAGEVGASVHLVAVVPGGDVRPDDETDVESTGPEDPEERKRMGSYLRRMKVRLNVEWDCPVFTAVLPDVHPAEALIDYADQIGAELVVAATHSKNLFSRAMFGSTAIDLVRRAPCPVLLVPSEEPAPDPLRTPLQEAPTSVIAALDPSGDSDAAVLGHALTIVKQFGAKLHLVEVLLPRPPATASPMGVPVAMGDDAMVVPAEPAEERLDEMVRDLRRRGIDAASHVLLGSRAADAVADVAESVDADLIVVGRHDKSFLERVALGSESDRLARRARSVGVLICPVAEEDDENARSS